MGSSSGSGSGAGAGPRTGACLACEGPYDRAESPSLKTGASERWPEAAETSEAREASSEPVGTPTGKPLPPWLWAMEAASSRASSWVNWLGTSACMGASEARRSSAALSSGSKESLSSFPEDPSLTITAPLHHLRSKKRDGRPYTTRHFSSTSSPLRLSAATPTPAGPECPGARPAMLVRLDLEAARLRRRGAPQQAGADRSSRQ